MTKEAIPYNHLCLIGCIRNPDKCPEYFFEIAGLMQGINVDRYQKEWDHYIEQEEENADMV